MFMPMLKNMYMFMCPYGFMPHMSQGFFFNLFKDGVDAEKIARVFPPAEVPVRERAAGSTAKADINAKCPFLERFGIRILAQFERPAHRERPSLAVFRIR